MPGTTPLLADLFDGTARLQPPAAATTVSIRLPPGLPPGIGLGVKTPVVVDPASGGYLSVTRGIYPERADPGRGDLVGNVYLLRSPDGVAFDVVPTGTPDLGIFTREPRESFYDASITIDNAVCPRRFVMSLECYRPGYPTAATCLSYTTTPARPETWSVPIRYMSGEADPARGIFRSASIGKVLVDHERPYLSWTEVNGDPRDADMLAAQNATKLETGREYVATSAIALTSLYQPPTPGHVGAHGTPYILPPLEPSPRCTASWDCANRDGQDWKVEGAHYYAVYAGANYHLCQRPKAERDAGLVNRWGVSIARSRSPLGPYPEALPEADVLKATLDSYCGISYTTVDLVGDALYVYYMWIERLGDATTPTVQRLLRSRVVAR